jgi:hypothetical protein
MEWVLLIDTTPGTPVKGVGGAALGKGNTTAASTSATRIVEHDAALCPQETQRSADKKAFFPMYGIYRRQAGFLPERKHGYPAARVRRLLPAGKVPVSVSLSG